MVTITQPDPIMKLDVPYHGKTVRVMFSEDIATLEPVMMQGKNWIIVNLTKSQCTQLIAALKSQRKRKGLK